MVIDPRATRSIGARRIILKNGARQPIVADEISIPTGQIDEVIRASSITENPIAVDEAIAGVLQVYRRRRIHERVVVDIRVVWISRRIHAVDCSDLCTFEVVVVDLSIPGEV